MAAVMLTTIDNPFNPFTEWDEWKKYDEQQKYFSCAFLDRVANTSSELSDEDYQLSIEHAIDEIIRYDVTCKYTKIYEDRGEGV